MLGIFVMPQMRKYERLVRSRATLALVLVKNFLGVTYKLYNITSTLKSWIVVECQIQAKDCYAKEGTEGAKKSQRTT